MLAERLSSLPVAIGESVVIPTGIIRPCGEREYRIAVARSALMKTKHPMAREPSVHDAQQRCWIPHRILQLAIVQQIVPDTAPAQCDRVHDVAYADAQWEKRLPRVAAIGVDLRLWQRCAASGDTLHSHYASSIRD